MSESPAPNPIPTPNTFNTDFFFNIGNALTFETANKYFLSLTGGNITYLNVLGNLDCGSLTIGGLSLNVGAITGVTPGICSASKALIVDSSRNINNINSLTSDTLIASTTITLGSTSISETEIGFLDGVSSAGTIVASKVITVNSSSQLNSNLQFATSRKILMNNSASSGAYIDMGSTASDRCISLFSDALSYYGFGANSSNLRSFSNDSFAWYTGATQAVIGTSIMTLNSAGLLTTASLTATSITGTLQTAAQPNITSIGTLTSLTATSITGTLQTAAQPNITSIGTLTSLNVSGVSSTSNTRITTTTNYNGIMDTASIVLKQSSTTNGNKVGIDFAITTNAIDSINTATCSIYHERIAAYQGDLVFSTKRIAIADSALTEALRISSTGTCSIANTSSGFQLNLGASGTGINTNALTTTSLTLGATAITATGIELNYLDLTTGPGTAEASKALVLDANKDISTIRNMSVSGIITLSASTASSSNITGALITAGGIGISNNTNATSSTNGGTFTTAGGVAVAKKIFAGDNITTSGKLICNISGQGFNHNDGVNNLVSYVNNAGFGANCYFGTATASNLVLQTNNIGYLTIDGSGSGLCSFTSSTDATSSSAGGCVQIAGGAAIAKSVYIGGNLSVTGTITLGGSLIDLGYITGLTAGTAVASKALVLDASKNISTINSVTSNYVVCNTAFNSPAATANLSTLNLNGIVTNYGVSSIKGNAALNSPSFATTNSVIYMESSNVTPITAEFGLSSGTGATSTNGLKLGTLSNNDFSLFTNAGIRMVIKANSSIGLGSNASTADKTLCLLDGTAGVTTTSFRIGNTLTTNNCMSMEWICSGGSGSGGNGLHFNPYGTSDALVINCNGYIGIGANGLYPLDIFSYRTSTVVAPYALSESTTASYVASPNLSGQNISLNCLHSALFLEKVFISSDRRLKKNIAPINLKVARQFLNVQPVVYHKREQADNDMLNFGYIAQDIMKNSIGELLCHVDNDNMKIEEDGDIPGIQFNVQYDKVAPLLHVIVKEHDNIIEKLKSKINNLEEILKRILYLDDTDSIVSD